MTTRFLRHIPTGVLYAYQEAFAIRADFEEVPGPSAAPVIPPIVRRRQRQSPAMPEPADEDVAADDAALSVEAARGLK